MENLESSLADAFAKMDKDALRQEGGLLFEGFEPIKTLWEESGVGVSAASFEDDDGTPMIAISVQDGEGGAEQVYSAPEAGFDPAAAAKAAAEDIEETLEPSSE